MQCGDSIVGYIESYEVGQSKYFGGEGRQGILGKVQGRKRAKVGEGLRQ